ncbi:Metaxin-3, partial [Mortierella alpina]
ELPLLHSDNNWIAGTSRIIAYLAKSGYDADEELSKEELSKSFAYSALVDNSLADALLFSWFADANNFLGATRKAYSNLFSIPARYILPIQMRKAAIQRVQKYGGIIEGGTLTKAEDTKIYDMTRDCYRVLDRKLGENDFFWGVKPTSLDAKVFSYLALQLYPDIPNPRFQMILTSQFPRLVAFCDRCREEFFANLPDSSLSAASLRFWTNPFSSPKEWFKSTFIMSSGSSQLTANEQLKHTPDEQDFHLKRVYAITFGVVAMVAHVILNGLVVVGNEGEDKGEPYVVAGTMQDNLKSSPSDAPDA